MRKKKEKGAIVIEATISLTAYVFLIFTILSVVNICYIQAKVGLALDMAAKEISQYSYLYYKFGVNELDKKISAGTEDEQEVAKSTIDGVGTFLSSMSDIEEDVETADFDSLMNDIDAGVTEVDSLVTMYADKLADDPKGFIIGMGKMAGSELKEKGKAILGQVMAKAFMKKNLMAYKGDDPDNFLKRHGIEDGMDGLDFNYTSLMAYGTSNQIQLVCTYDVKVIQLLNLDYTFKFRQCAMTTAWGDGISLITPLQSAETQTLSIWDSMTPTARGQNIVLEEKKNYDYVSTKKGFDAYDNSGGKNEFISIISIDNEAKSYQKEGAITSKLTSAYNTLYDKVNKLEDPITVQDKSGADVSLESPLDTRTYKLVLVVPDNAVDSPDVWQEVMDFQKKYPNVEVELKGGYGNHAPKEENGETENEAGTPEET